MGKFTYDSTLVVDFEDRLLAHLQVAITTKLRRGESFSFTWKDDVALGDGRTTIWVHPAHQLVFKFYGSRAPMLNRDWIEALMELANSNAGLHVLPEPPHEGQHQ